MRRNAFFLSLLAAALCAPPAARAEDGGAGESLPPPLRISLDASPISNGSYEALGADGYGFSSLGATISTSAAYAVVNGLEIGGGAAFSAPYAQALWQLRPYAMVRGYLPLAGDRLELGAAFRLGAGLVWLPLTWAETNEGPRMHEVAFYAGPNGALTLDARVWIGKRVGVTLSGEASMLFAPQLNTVRQPYFSRGTALGSLAAGPSIGVAFRL
jgi:hypothetical protein